MVLMFLLLPNNETQRFSFNLGFENTETTGSNVIQEISRTPIPGIVDKYKIYNIRSLI